MHSNAQHVCELFFIQHIIWFTIINLIAGETYVHVRHVDVISCQIFFVLCYCQGVFQNSTRKHEQRHRTAAEPTRLLLTKIRKKTLKRRHLSCKVHAPFIFAMLSPPCIIPQSYDRFSMSLRHDRTCDLRTKYEYECVADSRHSSYLTLEQQRPVGSEMIMPLSFGYSRCPYGHAVWPVGLTSSMGFAISALYRAGGPKKWGHKRMVIILSNLNWFSKCFHW